MFSIKVFLLLLLLCFSLLFPSAWWYITVGVIRRINSRIRLSFGHFFAVDSYLHIIQSYWSFLYSIIHILFLFFLNIFSTELPYNTYSISSLILLRLIILFKRSNCNVSHDSKLTTIFLSKAKVWVRIWFWIWVNLFHYLFFRVRWIWFSNLSFIIYGLNCFLSNILRYVLFKRLSLR